MATGMTEDIWNERSKSLQQIKTDVQKGKRKLIAQMARKSAGRQKQFSPSHAGPASRGGRFSVLPSVSPLGPEKSWQRAAQTRLPQYDPRPLVDPSHSLVPRVIDNSNYKRYLQRRFPKIADATTRRLTPQSDCSSRESTPPWPRDLEIPPAQQYHRNAQLYRYFSEHDGFAMTFTQEFIFRCLDDELIPDLLIQTITFMARQEAQGPDPVEVYNVWGGNKFFSQDFVHNFVDRCLGDEIVPDLLIEVIQEEAVAAAARQPRPPDAFPLETTSVDLMHDLLRQMVPQIVRDAVKESIDEEMRKHLTSVGLAQIFTTFLTNEFLADMLEDISRQAIRETGDEEIASAIAFDLLHILYLEMMREDAPTLARQSMGEYLLESTADMAVINDVVEEESRIVAREVLMEYSDKIRRRDLAEITRLSTGAPLAAIALDYFIGFTLGQHSVHGPSRVAHKALEGEVLDELFEQLDQIKSTAHATLDNHPLSRFHEKLTTDTGLDVLLNELISHVDGDLCDLDMDEVTDPNKTRYVKGIEPIFYQREVL